MFNHTFCAPCPQLRSRCAILFVSEASHLVLTESIIALSSRSPQIFKGETKQRQMFYRTSATMRVPLKGHHFFRLICFSLRYSLVKFQRSIDVVGGVQLSYVSLIFIEISSCLDLCDKLDMWHGVVCDDIVFYSYGLLDFYIKGCFGGNWGIKNQNKILWLSHRKTHQELI